MQIKFYLKNNTRKKFLISTQNDDVPIKKILNVFGRYSLGFCVIKVKDKYKIFTDGDFRRSIIKDNLFLFKKSSQIKNKKIVTIDIKETMYEAYKLMSKNKINCILVTQNKKIFSYLTLHEINDSLSPERLNLDKEKLKKFKLDVKKHLTRYNFANLFIKENSEVLDAACGVGYGTSILSQKSKNIIGIDYSKTAIKLAKKNYQNKKIKFFESDIINFKFEKKFDAIVSLETLEHISKKNGIKWIKKCYNLLKKDGIFVCSSPLLRIRDGKPFITNPHHLHEMKRAELENILKKTFKVKNINLFIQENNNLKPCIDENEGLSIFVLRKI
jgi:2-polyprenyl-3-methyl-5-hydroxy-6-metoxy-1,4-benzoquinol methylase